MLSGPKKKELRFYLTVFLSFHLKPFFDERDWLYLQVYEIQVTLIVILLLLIDIAYFFYQYAV